MNRFGMVSTTWMTNPALTLEARALYAILTTYCNRERSCYPSVATLMKICGKSRATIYRWLKELETQQIIRKVPEGKHRIIVLRDLAPGTTGLL